ncbi:MAG: efflux RND transporter periplasmic adaptor subunit [Candidatus Marinimicrobia bacterium]|nr:efflux RND transporter periplasmic adaptor subunit [Candidatus Neomarinimicrobiota bacterium]MCF7850619.1 efflux RND transporter periplasmic adaptor subunit [Candidatus Neomarinimicrobiota bacterium]MCF7903647.1 efflux RND transporter periplasmic adaptor subunit [Candidatus Neomarinimicrobiota bacterium]
MSKKKIIIIVVVVILVGIMAYAAVNKDKGNAKEVQAETVERGTVVHKVAASGKIQPVVEVNVSADVAGRVIRMAVEEGDWVEDGQFLAQLDATRYTADVERAQQVLASAEASLSLAELEKNQQYKLFEKKLVSELVYQSAMVRYQQALSSKKQALAALTQSRDNYNKTMMLAPMSGTVTQINKEVGEMALGSAFSQDVIMVVADLNEMEVLVDVNENDVVDVALGDTTEIEIDAIQDTMFIGVVTEIAHSAQNTNMGSLDQVTNFKVKIRLLDPPQEIRPGMSAAVDIRTDVQRDVLFVPIQSVTMRKPKLLEEKPDPEASRVDSAEMKEEKDLDPVEVVFVLVDNENGDHKEVIQREVKTGIIGDREFEIKSGLELGDEIVTGPYQEISRGLHDGDIVKVTKRKKFSANGG